MHIAYGGKKDRISRMHDKLVREDAGKKGYHSRAYHKHFEGYAEHRVLGADGRTTIKREYVGPVYEQHLSRMERIGVKSLYLAMLGIEIGLIVWISGLERISDQNIILTLAELAAILGISFLGYTLLVDYLFNPQQQTIGDYRSGSKGLQTRAKVLAILLLIAALVNLVTNLILRSSIGAADWYGTLGFAGGAVIAAGIYLIEKTIPYDRTEGQYKEPDDGRYEIEY